MPDSPGQNPFEPVAGYIRRWSTKYAGAPTRPSAVPWRRAELSRLADDLEALGRGAAVTGEAQAAFDVIMERLAVLGFYVPAELTSRSRHALGLDAKAVQVPIRDARAGDASADPPSRGDRGRLSRMRRCVPRRSEMDLLRRLVSGPRLLTDGPVGNCVKLGWLRVVSGDAAAVRSIAAVRYEITDAGLDAIRAHAQARP